jgi:serine/threonine protein kinase
MEFLRGLNLHELVARFGPQPESRVAFVLAQVCDALSEAHGVGLVHRDIKPANVFLCNRGGVPDWVKVLDFGLVREYGGAEDEVSTSGGRGLEGTPWFMPPESIKDSTQSEPRSDLYSVGALGYYLLTGRFVFDGQTIAELCEKHMTEIPPTPSQFATYPVSAEMDEILLKCLEKDPGQRPQSALELRDLLLASPKLSEWDVEARLTWWAKYQKATAPKPGETNYPEQTPMDVAVDVDLKSRM